MASKIPINLQYWFTSKLWKPFYFQTQSWQKWEDGFDGLLTAPTGSGKTYALFFPILIKALKSETVHKKGLRLLWITPLKSLARDLQFNMQSACNDLAPTWSVGLRTGDTSQAERTKQRRKMPEILITTPESLHLLLSNTNNLNHFNLLEGIVVDEWHELMGSKRGVQVELAISYLKSHVHNLRIWGMSATIGNLEEAKFHLLGNHHHKQCVISSDIEKKVSIESVIPDDVEQFPWAGHIGLQMLSKVLPLIEASQSSLVFTNTRSQAEQWFQKILHQKPDLAGKIALHHGSLDPAVRLWVEDALHDGRLKAVVCTSSLDLGVDFYPVDTVFQIGSPKGIARFLQRAGRSGHQPNALSRIYFVPTHSLELVEGHALKVAYSNSILESRDTFENPLDVLVQFLVTLSCGDGFLPEKVFPIIKNTPSFSTLSTEQWTWCLEMIRTGGQGMQRYDEYKKVIVDEDGKWVIASLKFALRHRLNIGTIVSEPAMKIRFLTGGYIGTVEEYFITKMKEGETFWFSGRNLEIVKIKDMTVFVRKSDKKKGLVPSWMGGRMPLSSQLSVILRDIFDQTAESNISSPEIDALSPIFEIQSSLSLIPKNNEFLVELIKDREGFHAFFFPFEGRLAHEGLASLFAWRISQILPISFSLAMNDYGFELLSDQEIPLEEAISKGLFSTENLHENLHASLNSSELAKRKFREIARIGGLIFQGYPGDRKPARHLQSSTQLLFDMFSQYDVHNLLVKQAYDEAFRFQLEEERIAKALERISGQILRIQRPERSTPFCFPILVDRLREKMSSESLEQRVRKMVAGLENYAQKRTRKRR